MISNPRENLQVFANAGGLGAIANLIGHEVEISLGDVVGISQTWRNPTIDYQISYLQRETLRLICRSISTLMGGNGGNFERLIRNLMDSEPLLKGLRSMIENPKTFGASVWSGSVNILSSFIHGEPTSYSVIAEAGLVDAFIKSIIGEQKIDEAAEADAHGSQDSFSDNPVSTPAPADLEETLDPLIPQRSLHPAERILPHIDAILSIPQAFGAICLNNMGKLLLLKSGALFKFFEVFVSAEHIKAMNVNVEYDTPRMLGSAFDELVRHHPDLKSIVFSSISFMIEEPRNAHSTGGTDSLKTGTRLFRQDEDTQMTDVVAGASEVVVGASKMDASGKSQSVEPVISEDEKANAMVSSQIEAAMRFLAGAFENSQLLLLFLEKHGASAVLSLVALPNLSYDFNNHAASQELAKVIHILVEQKPHLVLPDIVVRISEAVEELRSVYESQTDEGVFARFTTPGQNPTDEDVRSGTHIVKALVRVQTLCNILYEVFSPPIMNPRSTHAPFSHLNLTDFYETVVLKLGRLHGVCVWEEILLQNRLPEAWKEATRIKGYGMGSEEADEVFGFIHTDEVPNQDQEATANGTASAVGQPTSQRRKVLPSRDEQTPQFKNARTLRYLLSQIPSCIVPFFQGLGKSLVTKRRSDTYIRQNAQIVANALSQANIGQLRYVLPARCPSVKDRYAYLIVILTSISQLMIEVE